MNREKVEVIYDRIDAIRNSLLKSKKNDTILILGKASNFKNDRDTLTKLLTHMEKNKIELI